MRKVGETKTTSPINIVQTRVERSLLCFAVGQITFNLSVTINRIPSRSNMSWFNRPLKNSPAAGRAASTM